MTTTVHPGGYAVIRRERQRAQSLVEFALSSIILLLLAMGLVDLSRAFYYAVSLEGAAREGARHGAWYNTASRANIYLDDADILTAVRQGLYGAGFTDAQINPVTGASCLMPTDGNLSNNKPYPVSAYPTTGQTVNVYICYTDPTGVKSGSRLSPPTDNFWRLGDINVAILMNFSLITPFFQGLFGTGVDLAYNEHFTIQGKP